MRSYDLVRQARALSNRDMFGQRMEVFYSFEQSVFVRVRDPDTERGGHRKQGQARVSQSELERAKKSQEGI